MFLEISQNSYENTCNRVSFLIKLQVLGLRSATSLKNEALAQVFSYEFCEITENTFSYRTPPVAASEISNTFCANKIAFTLHESLTYPWK